MLNRRYPFFQFIIHGHEQRSVVTHAGTARAKDPLGQVNFLSKLAEAVPVASIHPEAESGRLHD
ncbi:hypothetical protein [Halobacillus litoralis]|uniref:hypothetical protein n=1 Tax=Halobacillus litoralis TaxID=45668 RepID=UPI001CD38C92|nr:hypothetical protein [Halobacillus litoralis]MCA1022002.1 hypothetical protein [Halobacillus litoralis]